MSDRLILVVKSFLFLVMIPCVSVDRGTRGRHWFIISFHKCHKVSEPVDFEFSFVVGFLITNITGFLVWVQFDCRLGCDITGVVSVLSFGCHS